MLAALIMRLFVSKEGLRGSIGWRRSWKYYLVALVTPIILVGSALLVIQVTGLGQVSLPGINRLVRYLPGAIIGIVFWIGEEYGWRGYLLPRLLPLGELKASIWVGVIWGLWHLPLVLAGYTITGVNPWLGLLVFLFFTLGMSSAFTRLFVASSGSVLIASLFHSGIDAYGGAFITEDIGVEAYLVIGAILLVAAVGYEIFNRRANTLMVTEQPGEPAPQ
jgi:hypothetical protein